MKRPAGGLLVGVPLLALLSCPTRIVRPPQPTVEELRLRRQVEKLRLLVADAEAGRLLHFDQMLVVVDEALVQKIVGSVVPLEGDVGGGFRVRIDTARAAFGDGLALLSLAGKLLRTDGSARAAMVVHGGLDVLELDAASGLLTARVKVFAVEVPEADVLGIDARRLTKVMAEGGLEGLLGPIQVPVRILGRLSFPPIREPRVRIAGMDLPVEVEVRVAAERADLAIAVRPSFVSALVRDDFQLRRELAGRVIELSLARLLVPVHADFLWSSASIDVGAGGAP